MLSGKTGMHCMRAYAVVVAVVPALRKVGPEENNDGGLVFVRIIFYIAY